jgi:hypothetical protein
VTPIETPLDDDTAVLPGLPDEPRDDDLARALDKAAPRHWWNKGTVVLGAFALLVGGFVGGLQVQQHWGTAAGASAGGNRAAGGFAGGQTRTGNAGGGYGNAGGGFPGGGAAPTAAASAAAAATTGTVKLVDGNTIYVQTANGDLVTVKTDAKTSVATANKGKLSDVKAGQSVTVQGAAGADGTVTATSVTAEKK